MGHRYGQQLLRRLPDRLLDAERLENAREFVRRTGAKGVVVGRWTAALRALVPGLAGVSQMPYSRFATANAAGGVLWAGLVASVGYIAGDSWHRVESDLGSASSALLGLILVVGVAWHVGRRLRARRRSPVAGKPVGADLGQVAGAPPAAASGQPVGALDLDRVAGARGPAGTTAPSSGPTAAADSRAAAVTLAAANPEIAAASAATTPTSYSRGDPVGEAATHRGPLARPDTSSTAEPA